MEDANNIHSLVRTAVENVRPYEKKSKAKPFRPKWSRFKMKIWFRDGNSCSYYSFDFESYKTADNVKHTTYSEKTAFRKLMRCAWKHFISGKLVTMEMWVDPTGKTGEDANYCYSVAKAITGTGIWVHPHLHFFVTDARLNVAGLLPYSDLNKMFEETPALKETLLQEQKLIDKIKAA